MDSVLTGLTITDFALYAACGDCASTLEESSANPTGYVENAVTNFSWLKERRIVAKGQWDLFRAGSSWRLLGKTELPAVIIVHGLHYNTADESSRQQEGEFNNADFKSCAAAALEAQFPGIPIIFLHTDTNLQFEASPPTMLLRVLPGSDIDNWAMGSCFPEELLSALICGRLLTALPYVQEVNGKECLDVLGMCADALLAGRQVLQLSCNRCQLSRRIVETVCAGKGVHSISAAWAKPPPVIAHPTREFFEYKEQNLYRFTYDELIDWGVAKDMLPLHLAAYWNTGFPLASTSSLPHGVFKLCAVGKPGEVLQDMAEDDSKQLSEPL